MLANLDKYASIMRNWCVSTDPICAANQSFSVTADHLSYYDLDSQAAASWIMSVASLTDDSSFTTSIATSMSGTVQGKLLSNPGHFASCSSLTNVRLQHRRNRDAVWYRHS
jgi:hypothetical protein